MLGSGTGSIIEGIGATVYDVVSSAGAGTLIQFNDGKQINLAGVATLGNSLVFG